MASLLEVKNLTTQFITYEGVVRAVNQISYELNEGETIAIAGESGSGKSVGVKSLLRLIPDPPGKITKGEVLFEGRDLIKLDEKEIEKIRGNKISVVFQDPMTSLNPVLTIESQIRESLKLHLHLDGKEATNRTIELLNLVGIPFPEERLKNYPHQLSGGMRQRVMIAIGIACNPRILIADEPTTALDVTIQAQIVDLVIGLQEKFGMAIIWVTHDLGVIAGLADRVLVMYAGKIVEEALVNELYKEPRHPYTIALIKSLPRVDQDERSELSTIKGMPPDLVHYPKGCPFFNRCMYRKDLCKEEEPTLQKYNEKHQVACFVDVNTGNIVWK